MSVAMARDEKATDQATLLRRARAGDRDAFASLARCYDDGLRALAYRLLGDRDRMDDALQEAYVEVVYHGRAAWRLDVDGPVQFIADRLEITIDRETGIPVQVVESRGGEVLSEHRVEQLAVDADYEPSAFRLAIPAGAEVSRSDGGFRRVALEEVHAITGYQPIVPAWVPDGYELAEVAVAEASDRAQAKNSRSHMVVSLSYRRAFDQFVVTTRLAGDGNWSDPLATGEGRHGSLDHPERLPIRQGAFRGISAELVITLRGIPHVWAHGDDLVLTVAGALSRDELVRVAESLERRA
jgi:hypothetical protein